MDLPPPELPPADADSRPAPQCAEACAPAGLEATYLQYSPILRRIAIRKFEIPLPDVGALVNDVFATFLTNPQVVRDVERYLVGGICNAAREYWRERNREVPLEGVEVRVEEAVADDISQRLAVAATIARLRGRCRDVLRRYYFDGEAKTTIAAALGTTPDNVLYILHVCRQRARRIYDAITQVR